MMVNYKSWHEIEDVIIGNDGSIWSKQNNKRKADEMLFEGETYYRVWGHATYKGTRVCITRDGQAYYIFIKDAVVMLFGGGYNPEHEKVVHVDGDKANNNISNLRIELRKPKTAQKNLNVHEQIPASLKGRERARAIIAAHKAKKTINKAREVCLNRGWEYKSWMDFGKQGGKR